VPDNHGASRRSDLRSRGQGTRFACMSGNAEPTIFSLPYLNRCRSSPSFVPVDQPHGATRTSSRRGITQRPDSGPSAFAAILGMISGRNASDSQPAGQEITDRARRSGGRPGSCLLRVCLGGGSVVICIIV
jgi:hypothetical protein